MQTATDEFTVAIKSKWNKIYLKNGGKQGKSIIIIKITTEECDSK